MTLAAGLLVTTFGAWKTFATIRSEGQARFNLHAQRLVNDIAQHMQQPVDGLHGLLALFRVVPDLKRTAFRTYVSSLDLDRDFPGVRGFGFVERVPRVQLDAFIARERADSGPDFRLGADGGKDDLLIVKYIEPAQRNQGVRGVDLSFDPVRREVVERAIASGELALSGPLTLIHHGAGEPGWLLMLPVFREPSDTLGSARQLRGLLYAPIAIHELLSHVQTEFDDDIEFRVHDALAKSTAPLFDSRATRRLAPTRTATSTALFEERHNLRIAGRSFDVYVSSTPQVEGAEGRIEAGLVALAGTSSTLLLALAVMRLSRSRQTAEATSKERERLIRLMIENIPARLSYWDRQLRCRMVNRALAAIFNASSDDIVGTPIQELLPPEKWKLLEPRVQAALAGSQQEFEWSTVSASGAPATMLFYCVPDVQNGDVAGVLLASIDITELKEAQKNAMQANEAKSQFLSNMSHEIRTPMNAVLGMLSLLRMTPLDERQGGYARKAESAARSLLGLLNDILDVSRIESGKMALDPQPFSLPALLGDLELILAATIGEKPVALNFDVDPTLPSWLVADDMRLRQVLINLGGNAIKFTHSGEVKLGFLRLGQTGDRVLMEVSVSDTGIGISPEEQRRIFAEFSQASASTTRAFGGSGLGLAICSRLLRLMASELKVDSTAGAGSRFHFQLWMPVAEERPVSSPSASLQPLKALLTAKPLRGLRVLLVEDNIINQQVSREVLAAAGAEVQIAENGQEAVKAIAAGRRFDAVLMDIQMPVMDGFAATREIRARLGETELPIIAMSANAMEIDREHSRDAGMTDHIGKPFIPEDLIDILLRHIRGDASAEGSIELGLSPLKEARPLAVVDRAGAVARMRDEVLYEQLVPAFLKDLRDALTHLGEIRDMRREDAIRMLHTLKCTAATMGANQLSNAAADAERMCKDGGEFDSSLLEVVAQQIDLTLLFFQAHD